jgi:predicted RNA binding protein YcfA (HicA-like mRNA interferase family)
VPESLPAITGRQLIRLLKLDAWEEGRRMNHGRSLHKMFPDGRTRVTIVPDKQSPLPTGTLAAILGPKQTGIGRDGLAALVREHGLGKKGWTRPSSLPREGVVYRPVSPSGDGILLRPMLAGRLPRSPA